MTDLIERLNGKTKAFQEPSTEVYTEPETAMTAVNSGYAALTSNALEIINENLKGQKLSSQLFDVIKSPSGGSTVFMVQDYSGEKAEKELTGIILDYTMPRAYWDTPDPKEGTPPVCYSTDSIVSFEGKQCETCMYNDFGSKDGDTNAKACKEFVEVILLRPDSIMPVIVRVPTTSKQTFQRYTLRLVGRMIPIYSLVTKITLTKATNKAGQPYALYNFEAIGTLSPEETARAKAFGLGFKEILKVDKPSVIIPGVVEEGAA